MQSCLICDDHEMMRDALAGSVAMHWPNARIVLAGTYPEAWEAARAQPDLILCDLGMPGASPVVGVDGVRSIAPDGFIVAVTASEDDHLLLDILDLGVAGFIPKTSSGAVIEAAIRLVLAGGRYLPPRMAELASRRTATEWPLVRGRVNGLARLTDRQMDILRLIAEGASNKEIARSLDLSPATVKAHTAAVISALGVNNRTAAAFRGREIGLL
jgi:two-component system, NarL family, nitrate/nitrite response regulator NarL